jgi:hypothetical protein
VAAAEAAEPDVGARAGELAATRRQLEPTMPLRPQQRAMQVQPVVMRQRAGEQAARHAAAEEAEPDAVALAVMRRQRLQRQPIPSRR